ncbi:MAG: dimethyl sulfoxide reductase anchor subunit family protein [Burkholderiales bacterium]
MRPALSVIVFTVLSGAGLGLFSILAFGSLLDGAFTLGDRSRSIGGAIALVLVVAGLLSSTLHLANPRNAWRAVTQFRYSWLSREAILAMMFLPIASLHVAAPYTNAPDYLRVLIAITGIALAWGILLCTGMIYACLKTIPQWNSPVVPLSYFILGHWSGALIAATIVVLDGSDPRAYIVLCAGLLVASSAVKLAYYLRFDRPRRDQRTLIDALGVTAAAAKLLDVGHAQRTFLTQEFLFRVGRRHALVLRLVFMLLSFVAPLVVLASWSDAALYLGAAAFSCLAGLLVERWLFFAEAEHVVRLYHGAQKV